MKEGFPLVVQEALYNLNICVQVYWMCEIADSWYDNKMTRQELNFCFLFIPLHKEILFTWSFSWYGGC